MYYGRRGFHMGVLIIEMKRDRNVQCNLKEEKE